MTSRFRLVLLFGMIVALPAMGQSRSGASTPPVDKSAEPKAPASTDPGKPAADSPKEGSADAPKDKDKDDKDKDKDKGEKQKKNPIEVATFGAGCFWSTEAVFERIPGVQSVVSGFSGGNVPNPTYQMVGTGQTGHAEVVQIVFDSRKVPYTTLLKVFWKAHDPTTMNQQGDDFGPQYRSVIFYHSEEQRDEAIHVYNELKVKRVYRGPIVTQLFPFKAFFPAEPYHQDYFANHPDSVYSQNYIVPKLWKLKLNSTRSSTKTAQRPPTTRNSADGPAPRATSTRKPR